MQLRIHTDRSLQVIAASDSHRTVMEISDDAFHSLNVNANQQISIEFVNEEDFSIDMGRFTIFC